MWPTERHKIDAVMSINSAHIPPFHIGIIHHNGALKSVQQRSSHELYKAATTVTAPVVFATRKVRHQSLAYCPTKKQFTVSRGSPGETLEHGGSDLLDRACWALCLCQRDGSEDPRTALSCSWLGWWSLLCFTQSLLFDLENKNIFITVSSF